MERVVKFLDFLLRSDLGLDPARLGFWKRGRSRRVSASGTQLLPQ